MKKITKEWLKCVQTDMEAAQILFDAGHKLGSAYINAVFHCHQAVEKMIKAILVNQNKKVIKIHNLVRLVALAGLTLPENIKIFIGELNPHYLTPRYPDMKFRPDFTFTYNRKNTLDILNRTKETILCLEKKLTT